MKLLKFSKAKKFAQHHTESKWQSQDVCVTLVFLTIRSYFKSLSSIPRTNFHLA